jgi:hypothetical protein
VGLMTEAHVEVRMPVRQSLQPGQAMQDIAFASMISHLRSTSIGLWKWRGSSKKSSFR